MTSLIKTLTSFGITGWLAFLAIAILFYILIFYYKYFTRENPLPGPFPLPVVGSLYQNPGHFAKWIQDLHKKYGDMFEIWIGSQRQIWLNNAELIAKTTLTSLNTAFIIRYSHDSGLEEWGDTTGIGFNRVPWSWRYNRRLVNDAVNSLSFLKEFTGMMQRGFGELETYWKEIGLDKPQDIQLWVNRFISDMLYITTTGKNVKFMAKHFNSLSTDKKVELSTTMRLHSTAPIMFRTNNERTEVGGFSWKPDTQFGVNFQSVHHSSDLWKDADKFIPERHLLSDKDLKRKFYPFGGGLHICPGRLFGTALLKTLVVVFFRKYNVELENPNTPIRTSHDFTLHSHDAIVRLSPRITTNKKM
ncbi:5937_t:CDS:2 [Ambispora leptoticha]|uniref:5937_t:CDS:1 n=1 Tax=Ambispora leptoticha TaxID=144679 RepID=A0A9N9DQS6_9GLOM|nr:5937_t:CDS:2 [Ambispora leptoticha]